MSLFIAKMIEDGVLMPIIWIKMVMLKYDIKKDKAI